MAEKRKATSVITLETELIAVFEASQIVFQRWECYRVMIDHKGPMPEYALCASLLKGTFMHLAARCNELRVLIYLELSL